MRCDVEIDEFIRTGALGDLRIGASAGEALVALVPAEASGPTSRSKKAILYKYGPLQVTVAHDLVVGIWIYFHYLNTELPLLASTFPRLADSLGQLSTQRSKLVEHLDVVGISTVVDPTLTFDDQACIQSPSGVHLVFDGSGNLEKILISDLARPNLSIR